MSLDIRATDLGNKFSIMHILLKYRAMFLNNQSRYILGHDLENGEANMMPIVNEYEYIGTNENLSALLEKMGISINQNEDHKNSSPYHFDKSIFDDEEIEEFLTIHNRIDNKLYSIIQAKNNIHKDM